MAQVQPFLQIELSVVASSLGRHDLIRGILGKSSPPPHNPHFANILEHFNSWNRIDDTTLKVSDVALFAHARPQ